MSLLRGQIGGKHGKTRSIFRLTMTFLITTTCKKLFQFLQNSMWEREPFWIDDIFQVENRLSACEIKYVKHFGRIKLVSQYFTRLFKVVFKVKLFLKTMTFPCSYFSKRNSNTVQRRTSIALWSVFATVKTDTIFT